MAFATAMLMLSLTLPRMLPLVGVTGLSTKAEALASAPPATVTDLVLTPSIVKPAGAVTTSEYVPGGTSAKV